MTQVIDASVYYAAYLGHVIPINYEDVLDHDAGVRDAIVKIGQQVSEHLKGIAVRLELLDIVHFSDICPGETDPEDHETAAHHIWTEPIPAKERKAPAIKRNRSGWRYPTQLRLPGTARVTARKTQH